MSYSNINKILHLPNVQPESSVVKRVSHIVRSIVEEEPPQDKPLLKRDRQPLTHEQLANAAAFGLNVCSDLVESTFNKKIIIEKVVPGEITVANPKTCELCHFKLGIVDNDYKADLSWFDGLPDGKQVKANSMNILATSARICIEYLFYDKYTNILPELLDENFTLEIGDFFTMYFTGHADTKKRIGFIAEVTKSSKTDFNNLLDEMRKAGVISDDQ